MPNSGGPVCELVDHDITKMCWNKSIHHWEIVAEWQYLVPPFLHSHDEFVALWHHVEHVTRNHYLRVCVAGAVGPALAVAKAGAQTAIAAAAGGCISGMLTYYWLSN